MLPAGRVDVTRPGGQSPSSSRLRRRSLLKPVLALLSCTFGTLLLARLVAGEERWVSMAARRQLQDDSSPTSTEEAPAGRPFSLSVVAAVLGSNECDTRYDNIFGVVVEFLLIMYTFIGLAIVCDEYFVESLEQISGALNLSEDVAGATFMAAGSSAPELFTAIITIFVEPGEEGVGTIVGSAVFNICVIIGLTSLFAGQTLQLWWYPLMRDSFVYGLSIVGMVWAMYDKKVTLFESGILVLIYLGYVLLMVFNNQISEWVSKQEAIYKARRKIQHTFDLQVTPFKRFIGLNPRLRPEFRSVTNRETEAKRSKQRATMQKFFTTAIVVNKAKDKWVERVAIRKSSNLSDSNSEKGGDADGTPSVLSFSERVLEVVAMPLSFAMKFTIPDCRVEDRRGVYPFTFTMSIVWIGFLSFMMVDFADRAGCVMGVPDFLMGLVVLSVGTSVPDALSSILVARNGQGNMAVCNVLGSNVFNILLGLGLPWMLANVMYNQPYYTGDTSIVEPALILFGYLFALILILIIYKWQLSGRLGVLLLILQGVYWGWNVAEEYQLFSVRQFFQRE